MEDNVEEVKTITTSTAPLNGINDILSQGGPNTATTIFNRGNKLDFIEVRPTKGPGKIDYGQKPSLIVKFRR